MRTTDEDGLDHYECEKCGEVFRGYNGWPDNTPPQADWYERHRACDGPQPCRLCGKETNTPDACFECYHAPYGVGWEDEMMERMEHGYR